MLVSRRVQRTSSVCSAGAKEGGTKTQPTSEHNQRAFNAACCPGAATHLGLCMLNGKRGRQGFSRCAEVEASCTEQGETTDATARNYQNATIKWPAAAETCLLFHTVNEVVRNFSLADWFTFDLFFRFALARRRRRRCSHHHQKRSLTSTSQQRITDRAALAMAACLTARLGRPSICELAPDLEARGGCKGSVTTDSCQPGVTPGQPPGGPTVATRQPEKQHVQSNERRSVVPNHVGEKKPSEMAADMR